MRATATAAAVEPRLAKGMSVQATRFPTCLRVLWTDTHTGPVLAWSGRVPGENGFFAQDDYRVTPRLTLNLGLRYDVLTLPVEGP